MEQKRDFYEVLGLTKDATPKEIKKAYHRLAKKYHPDSSDKNSQAGDKFKEISESYEILGDETKKRLYDQYGMRAVEAGFDEEILKNLQAQENSSYRYQRNPGRGYDSSVFTEDIRFDRFNKGSGVSEDDILREIFNESGFNQSSFFKRNFAGRSESGSDQSFFFERTFSAGKGKNFESSFSSYHPEELSLWITLEESVNGCEKTIRTPDGSKSLQVRIPAGIGEGQKIRLQNQSRVKGRGCAGDLFLKIHIQEHPFYKKRGQDILTTANIPCATAVRGGKAYFQTLYGPVECSIPPGIHNGSKIRLKQKGLASLRHPEQRGDHYVTIQLI